MTKKNRKIIFLIFLFLFILIAPPAVLYSQGYRFDFESKKISQTGGIFLKILPKQAEVYLNGELSDETDFFFNSLLIENLLPGSYRIEVKKDGFHPWGKTLPVKKKEVTEAKTIILFPENPGLKTMASQVNDFWFSPDQKKIVLKEEDKKGWALKLYQLEKNVKSHLVSENDVSPAEADLFNLKFSEDSKEIYLETGIAERVRYFTLALDQTPPLITETEAPLPLSEKAIAYKKVKDDFYHLEDSGHLFKNNEKLTLIPLSVKQETEYEISVFQDSVFLQENETLYRLNPGSKSFDNLFEGIRSLRISPDNKKLAYFSDNEIWLFLLEDESSQEKAGEKIFLMRLSEAIKDCLWLNSDYLALSLENAVKITELDGRDKINIVGLAELKNPRIFWNAEKKTLYILSEGNLLYSDPLLP